MAVNNVESLMKKFNQLGTIQPIVAKTVRKYSEVVRGVAVKLCPVDTSELRSSIHTKVESTNDSVIGTVYTNKEYAAYVEFGTGPMGQSNHAGISPEVAVSYRQDGWVYPDADGGFHYTEGHEAQPYMYPALKTMEKPIISGMQADLAAGIRKLGG